MQLGFTLDKQFSDDTAACVVISDTIYAMLLKHDKFKQFTPKEISDATKTTEVLNAFALASKDQVNDIADAAIAAGGSETRLSLTMDLCSHMPSTTWTNTYGNCFTCT
jgi:uncharacterized protein